MTYSEKIAEITNQGNVTFYSTDFPVFESDVYKEAWSLTFASLIKGMKSLIKLAAK